MKRLIVAAILAATSTAAWADLPELENVERNLTNASQTQNLNDAHNLATTFDGAGINAADQTVVAGEGNTDNSGKNINLTASKKTRIDSSVPVIKEEAASSLTNFLKNEGASTRGTDIAVLVIMCLLGAVVMPAAIGYIAGAAVGAVAGLATIFFRRY